MSQELVITPIATIRTEFSSKFGIPRQAGLAEELRGTIVFEPDFRVDEALRGLEGFSHIWLIWGFSENREHDWTPTVRPPRLGGNVRMGVFATRSPFRPNGLGLSCVRLIGMQKEDRLGTTLTVAGADLMDGTPIYDIKPYLPYADCRPEAAGGFASEMPERLEILIPPELKEKIPEEKLAALAEVLAQDPRPRYQEDPQRIYGMSFAGLEIRFRVENNRLIVVEIR
ncbi:MAG: tRNA (N6-threonylcarbamoyladenosine(37)-N6)-methyltransferase TrmO [Candidatus Limivicinus sp.]